MHAILSRFARFSFQYPQRIVGDFNPNLSKHAISLPAINCSFSGLLNLPVRFFLFFTGSKIIQFLSFFASRGLSKNRRGLRKRLFF